MRVFGRFVTVLWQAVVTLVLVAGFGAIAALRMPAVPAGVVSAAPDALRLAAADSFEAAIGVGGSGISFEVVQVNTLRARPDGPRIEIREPADPQKVTAIVDEYQLGIVLSRGGVTADAFWMDMLIARGEAADFAAADLFARVLERDGKLWRDDGVGWYLTDQSPGVGMDPVTARSLPGALRSLQDGKALEPAVFGGRALVGIRGTTTPDAYPGVIAADGAGFTEQAFALDCWFDEQGRLVRMEARARNRNQDTYDLVSTTTVTFTYGPPGDPPDPSPTMAPEVPPTSEPGSVEVGS